MVLSSALITDAVVIGVFKNQLNFNEFSTFVSKNEASPKMEPVSIVFTLVIPIRTYACGHYKSDLWTYASTR